MESPSEQGRRMRPPEPSHFNVRGGSGEGARSPSDHYDDSDEPTTIFSMEDIGGDEQQAEAPQSALGDREALDDKDDVFTSSTGSATSSHEGRSGGRFAAGAPGLYVPAAPLPISGSAYHFRAHRAWLSLSAPHSAGFYLGPLPSADGYVGSDLDEDQATASGSNAVGGDGGVTTQDADDLTFGSRQPLPDLVPRTSETFRRRTYSESSVSVVTVRQFGSELRRMSDVFEHEVLEAKAISTIVVTARHKTAIFSSQAERNTTALGDGAPGDDAGRPIVKRRSSGFMQDLKDLLRRNNSPSSL